jgi:hypothetical protein
MREWIYSSTFFLTSALVEVEWSASLPGRFTPRERAPGNHRMGGWVDPRADLDDVEEKILDPTVTQTATPRSSSPQPVAIATTLSRLQNCNHAKIYRAVRFLYLTLQIF